MLKTNRTRDSSVSNRSA